MNTETIVDSRGLADLLKSETWNLHKEAETTGFINQVLRGTASLPGYISFLKNLKPIYEKMESSRRWLETYPSLKPYIGEPIARTHAIETDLEHLRTLCKEPVCPAIFPNTLTYQADIEKALTQNHPAMLAHIYVRYLGDLNGGLVLQRLLGKNLGLPEECLNFYNFPKIDNVSGFKKDFRKALNDIALPEDDEDRAIEAAKNAFRFNVALSTTLTG